MLYASWLAPRLPDPEMTKRSKQYMWLLLLIYVIGLCDLGLGPLVATIMYLLFLNRLRLALRWIRQQQQAERLAFAT
jgi:hypothetical protein